MYLVILPGPVKDFISRYRIDRPISDRYRPQSHDLSTDGLLRDELTHRAGNFLVSTCYVGRPDLEPESLERGSKNTYH
jgi:hypothetical protein